MAFNLGLALLAIALMFGVAHVATHGYTLRKGQLFPGQQAERRPEIPYLLGSHDIHVPSVKPLDAENFRASHGATVTPIALARKRVM